MLTRTRRIARSVASKGFERLEGRRLFSAGGLDNPVVLLDWKGQTTEAEAGEFILSLSGKTRMMSGRDEAGQVSALRRALRSAAGVTIEEHLGRAGQFLLDVPQDRPYEDVLASVQKLPGFEYLEPNFVFSLEATPNDPLFAYEYGLHNTGSGPLGASKADADIDAAEAWDVTTGGAGDVVIGVVDSGIDYTHPDLAPNMWRNPFETAGDGVDNDGNGYVDDVHGINAIANNGNPMDDNSHGTHAAGTIAAAGNNGVGITGVAWDAKLMGLKFLAADGSGSTADAIECLNYATSMRQKGVNIRLTSNSWGGGGFEQALSDAVARTNAAGMLFVAAAGNGGEDGVGDNNDVYGSYPANYNIPNVLSVAATDRYDNLAGFSNFGAATVDLAAPGVEIASTVPGNGYAYMSGTSMATPHVAGVAALAFAHKPSATVSEVRSALLSGVDTLANLSGKVATGGRLNALNTLRALGNSLAGVAFDDADGDGSRGGAEAALAGRTVWLDLDNDGAVDSATETVVSANAPLAIPDRGGASSTLAVAGTTGVVTDVNVTLDITHAYDSDVRAHLVSPAGRRVELVSAAGGAGDNFTATVFDDEAATAVTSGAAPFTGSFKPTGSLADFDGAWANGTWTLQVDDVAQYDAGTLRNWSITLTTGEPTRTTDSAGTYKFGPLPAGTYTVRQVVPIGWSATTPGAGYHAVQVVDGQNYAGRDFGSRVAVAADPNDQLSEAFALPVGTGANGVVGDGGVGATDVDTFSFTVVAGQRVAFDVDAAAGTPFDSYLRLFNASGVQLASSNNAAAPGEAAGTESYVAYTFSTAGTYFASVSGNPNAAYDAVTGNGDVAGTIGSYTISLVNQTVGSDADDQLGEARTLAVGSVTAGESISSGTDVDMFRFTAVAGQRLAFDVDRPSGGAIDSYLRVFDATGRQLAVNDNGAAPGEGATPTSYVEYTFATGGTYFVGVSGSPNKAYSAVSGGTDLTGRGGTYSLTISPAGLTIAGAATARSLAARGYTWSGTFSEARVAAVEALSADHNDGDVLTRVRI